MALSDLQNATQCNSQPLVSVLTIHHHSIRAIDGYSIPPFQTRAMSNVFEMFLRGLLPGLSKSKSARYPSLIDPRPVKL
jgi:hypothetical protein